jgi:hypothetical protein
MLGSCSVVLACLGVQVALLLLLLLVLISSLNKSGSISCSELMPAQPLSHLFCAWKLLSGSSLPQYYCCCCLITNGCNKLLTIGYCCCQVSQCLDDTTVSPFLCLEAAQWFQFAAVLAEAVQSASSALHRQRVSLQAVHYTVTGSHCNAVQGRLFVPTEAAESAARAKVTGSTDSRQAVAAGMSRTVH